MLAGFQCYVTCPKCGERIRAPFSRLSGPVPFIHHTPARRGACRLIVEPSVEGDTHRAEAVPDDVRLEDALLAAQVAWRREGASP